ncbi:MAG: response regulator transcription factor, partial [Deltaproteobacteria bacterium]|nr:response regulator transcription factor [Deltaproteobacteria bacterium]
LLARVRSVLRRQRWEQVSGNNVKATTLSFGEAEINFDTHEVTVSGEEVQLTQLELDLIRYFAVDNFISRLRRRFEQDPSSPTHILSVRGAGYKFIA